LATLTAKTEREQKAKRGLKKNVENENKKASTVNNDGAIPSHVGSLLLDKRRTSLKHHTPLKLRNSRKIPTSLFFSVVI